MEQAIWRQAANPSFWENYAPWYRQWITHSSYHEKILTFVTSFKAEREKIKSGLARNEGHLWAEDEAYVGIFCWKGAVGSEKEIRTERRCRERQHCG